MSEPSQGDLSERAITTKIEDIERALIRTYAAHASDPFVLQTEARYRDALNQDQRAFTALKKAHGLNPSLVPISLRLSRMYTERSSPKEAIQTLATTLERTPAKELRFEIAKLISGNEGLQSGFDPIELLERSFEPDDEQLMPRLYLMREYWKGKSNEKYRQLQRQLKRMSAPRSLRSQPNLVIESDGKPISYTGMIARKEADYVFISCPDGHPDVFLHRSNAANGNFDTLRYNDRVSFSVGFSTSGATAVM